MNSVILMGRLVKDLELKKSGVANRTYSNNSIAVDRGKDKDGNKKESIFVNFNVWERNAEYLVNYAKKGSRVIIEGRLDQTKEYNHEKNINEYQLILVPTNITIIDFKDTSNVSALTGELPKEVQRTNSQIIKDVMEEEDPFKSFSDDQLEITDDDLPF